MLWIAEDDNNSKYTQLQTGCMFSLQTEAKMGKKQQLLKLRDLWAKGQGWTEKWSNE